MTLDPSITLASRVLGALIFATAVIGKVGHRRELAGVVANYRLVPEQQAVPSPGGSSDSRC